MMVMRYEPLRELERLTQHLTGSRRTPTMMPMDAYRRGDRFIVHFDLPGVDPNAIDLTVEKNNLTVTAERSWQSQEGDAIVVSERPEGAFRRQVLLGEGLDPDRVEATYEAGVLTVTIPVAATAKPRRIPIVRSGDTEVIDTSATPREDESPDAVSGT
jgi:HSP20 family protein